MNQTDTTQILHFTNSNINEFVILLLATLIGAFVGFGLVLMWDRRKKHQDDEETKKRIISAMIVELEQIEKGLEKQSNDKIEWHSPDHCFRGKHHILSFGTFESAKYSGSLSLLKSELQLDLDNFNNRIRSFNIYLEQILTFSSSATFVSPYANDVAINLIDQMNVKIQIISKDLKPLLEKLKQD